MLRPAPALAFFGLLALEVAAHARPADQPTFKWEPNTTKASSTALLAGLLRQDLRAPMHRHAIHVRDREASLAFAAAAAAAARPRLVELLAPGLGQGQARELLSKITTQPAATWAASLRRAIQAQPKSAVAASLRPVLVGLLGPQTPGSGAYREIEARTSTRLASWLMARAGRVDERLLPERMPLLPVCNDAGVQAMIEQAMQSTRTPRQLYLHLERQTALLRGSSREEDRTLAGRLGAYLGDYKASWAPAWLEQRLGAFRPSAAAWKPKVLVSDLLPMTGDAAVQAVIDRGKRPKGTVKELHDFLQAQATRLAASQSAADRDLAGRLAGYLAEHEKGRIGSQEAATIQRRVDEAFAILARVVHPALLRRLPPVTVQLTRAFAVPGVIVPYTKATFAVRPESSVKDILHELGHMLEFFGGPRVQALSHALLVQRAFGTPSRPLSELLSGTSYTDAQRGWEGGFVAPYMGRHYSDGFTEVESMGVQSLTSRDAALELFQKDGYYVLGLLSTLQQPPRLPRIGKPARPVR